MLAAEVFARFTGDHSSLVRSAGASEKAIRGVENAAKRASTGMSSSMNKVNQANEKTSSGFMKTLGTVTKIGAAIGILNLVGQAFDGIKSAVIDYNSTLEQAQIGFTTMLGSADAATRMMEKLQRFAATTPFEFKGLLSSTRQLMAFGFEAQETLPTLRIIGDSVAAMGGSMEDMGDRVIRSFGQMSAKGKVSAEEMMQLAEAGLPAWQYLADAIGTDIPTAMQQAKTSGVAASVAIDGILKGMNRDFGGMMEAQSKTMMGAWSNVMDFLQQQTAAATRGIYERFRDTILQVAEFLGSPQAAAMGERIAEGMNNAIDTIISALSPLAKQFADTFEAIISMAGELVGNLEPMGLAIAGAFVVGLKGAEMFLSVIETLATFFAENEAAAKGLATAITLIVAAMAANKVMNFVSAFAGGIANMVSSIGNLGRVQAAFSAIERTTTNLTPAMATFAATNSAAIGKVSASAGAGAISMAGFGASISALLPLAAVTLVIVGIADAIMSSAKAAQEAEARYKAYKGALESLEGFEPDDFKFFGAVADQLDDMDELMDVLDDAGISVNDVAKAFIEGGDAAQRMRDDILAAAEATGLSAGEMESFEMGLDREMKAFNDASEAAQRHAESQREVAAEEANAERASKLLGETVGSLGSTFGDAARSAGKAGEELQKVHDGITETWTGAANPFEEWTKDSLISLDDFQANLEERLGMIGRFSTNLMTLLEQGLDPTIIQHMAEEGPEAYAMVVAELAQSPEELAGFQSQMQQYLNLDDTVAGVANNIDLVQDILNGMSTQQLKIEWGSQIQSEINKLPQSIQLALARNDQGISGKVTEAIQGALAQANDFARQNPMTLDAEVDVEEASRQFDLFMASMPTPEVLVGADPADALATITDFLVEVGSTPANVPIEGMDTRARGTAEDFIDFVESQVGTIDFEGDPEKANEILAEFLGLVDSSAGVTTIDADLTPGQLRLLDLTEQMNSTTGTVDIDADSSPGIKRLEDYESMVNRSQPIVDIDGNDALAAGELNRFITMANSARGTAIVDANTSAARDEASALVSDINNLVATIQVRLRTDQLNAQLAGARTMGLQQEQGGIVEFFAQGGRRENHVAQIARPGAWRIWAEPETGGEAYIPLAMGKRSRSMNILAEVADRFGYVLVKSFEDGKGINDSKPPAIDSSMLGNTSNNFNVNVGVNVRPTAGVDSKSLADAVAKSVEKGVNDTMKELLDEVRNN